MKNTFVILFILLKLASCSLSPNLKIRESKEFIVFHSRFYINSILVGEKYFNSKTGIYKIYEKTPSTFIDKEIKINLSKQDVNTIYNKYKILNIPNKKLCMEMKEEGKDILIERQMLINSDNIHELKECAAKENDQANIDMIISQLLNLIKSSEEYKMTYPMADWEF